MISETGGDAAVFTLRKDDTPSTVCLPVTENSCPSVFSEKAEITQSYQDLTFCPKDLDKVSHLKPIYFVLDNGLVFIDKLLPDPSSQLIPRAPNFSKDYYVQLHYHVSSFNDYNYLGAHVPLQHSYLRVKKFRELLPADYEDSVILQYMEYGFPLGLQEEFVLKPVLKNHSGSYEYFSHVDRFIGKELEKGGLTGPFSTSPFTNVIISPLMTAPKKPNSR